MDRIIYALTLIVQTLLFFAAMYSNYTGNTAQATYFMATAVYFAIMALGYRMKS